MNSLQKYIYEDDKKWFTRIEPFLKGDVLKVGNGLGYLSSFIENKSKNFEVIDIQKNKLAINKKRVRLYNGLDFPFEAKSFDSIVCTYVLHHAQDPDRLLSEMKRVGKRLIILEETYDNLLSKMDLVYRDIYVNLLADQPSKVYWSHYYKKAQFIYSMKKGGFRVRHHYEEKKRSYWKELIVLEKNK